jgi:hypothetical protein
MKCVKANTVDSKNAANHFSFQQQNNYCSNNGNHQIKSPFHLHTDGLTNERHAAETDIKIIAAKQHITSPLLCRYLKERCINKNIADIYCYEVRFTVNNNDREYVAIGFKNNAGGYELRDEFFKLDRTPKYVTYISNDNSKKILNSGTQKTEILPPDRRLNQPKFDEQNRPVEQVKSISVFEEFFDFLSWQAIHQNQQHSLTNFLVLNSLSFFERSLLLMEKHEHISLYLNRDIAGRKCVEQALKRSTRFEDKSGLYKGHKDLNDWLMNFGKLEKKRSLNRSAEMELP